MLKDPFSGVLYLYIRARIRKLNEEYARLERDGCERHNLPAGVYQDCCPCDARLFYLYDRLEESYQGYVKKQQFFGFFKWLKWYSKSSREFCLPSKTVYLKKHLTQLGTTF